MSKSILIMDTPKNCDECPLVNSLYFGVWCNSTGKELEDTHTKPDWCPLSLLPERINLRQYVDNCAADMNSVIAYAYAQGYNDCLDEILEEE